MTAFLSFMRDVNLVAFCALALACAVQWRRQEDQSVRWATGAFSALASVGILGELIQRQVLPTLGIWPIKLVLLVLCLFPYLLYRFVMAYERPSRAVEVVASASTLVVAVATLALSALPSPIPGTPDPPWWTQYRALILVQWTVLFTIVTVRLWRASRHEGNVSRQRLRTLALGATGLNAAILASGVVPAVAESDPIRLVVAVLLLLSSILFFVGLAPPAWIVILWRQPVQAAIETGMRDLFQAEDQAAVCAALLPHLAMAGARGGALVAPDGTVVARSGDTAPVHELVGMARGPEDELPRGVHRLRLQAGTLLVWRSAYAPFFSKGELETLEALGHFSDIVMDRCALAEGQRQTKLELAFQATHDHLTGLPNRVLLFDRLTQSLAQAQRRAEAVAVLFLDVDRFKVINDSLGHSLGDEVLRTVAARLRALVRPGDTVARFGGDEFVVVAEGPFDGDDAGGLARRIAGALAVPVSIDGTDVVVTVSMGLAVAHPGDDAESLLRDADAAMYRAKEGGRDRCLVFDAEMRATAERRLFVERALRRAIDDDEVVLRYQPQVELASGRIVGVEALARISLDGEELQPAEFIPVAEETGLVIPLGSAVLRGACAQLTRWRTEIPGLEELTLSVNRSARELLMPGADLAVAGALASAGVEARHLCLEITESVLLDDAEASARALAALKRLGVTIAVDDFGTGYSSLTYLKQFPVDTLKIDRSFVAGLVDGIADRGDRAIVAGVVDLAHAFGLTTIAEGVESQEQLTRLHQLGCELAQGFFLGGPMDPGELGWWLGRARQRTPLEPVRTRADGDQRTRVLLVDDDRALRTLFALLLEDHPDYVVVASAPDGREAVALARHHQPELIVLDLAMPGVGGLEALPLLRAVAPGADVVVVSGLDPIDVEGEALARGACGFVSKEIGPDRIVAQLGRLRTPA